MDRHDGKGWKGKNYVFAMQLDAICPGDGPRLNKNKSSMTIGANPKPIAVTGGLTFVSALG